MNMRSAITEEQNDLYCYYPEDEGYLYTSDSALSSVRWAVEACLGPVGFLSK